MNILQTFTLLNFPKDVKRFDLAVEKLKRVPESFLLNETERINEWARRMKENIEKEEKMKKRERKREILARLHKIRRCR